MFVSNSSSLLEKTIFCSSNMNLTQYFRHLAEEDDTAGLLHLFANPKCYLLPRCVLQRSSRISRTVRRRFSSSEASEKRWKAEWFSQSHLRLRAFYFLSILLLLCLGALAPYQPLPGSYGHLQGATVMHNTSRETFVWKGKTSGE